MIAATAPSYNTSLCDDSFLSLSPFVQRQRMQHK